MDSPDPGIVPLHVLLVEDSPGDVKLTLEAFRSANPSLHLHVAGDGFEALSFLRSATAPRPDLVLLDLNLPKMDGLHLLAQMKRDKGLKSIPAVILTTSAAEVDVTKCYQLHANSYFTKPIELADFEALVKTINNFWLTLATLPPQGTKRPSLLIPTKST